MSLAILTWRSGLAQQVVNGVVNIHAHGGREVVYLTDWSEDLLFAVNFLILPNRMTTLFTQLNHGWNAEPNAPHPTVEVAGSAVTLSFLANPFVFPEFVSGQIIRLRFIDVWRYGVGAINDEGWHRGQCRFSTIAPSWGEFYEVSGDLKLDQFHGEWHLVSEPTPTLHHFLFYFRDENFECDAVSWERIQ